MAPKSLRPPTKGHFGRVGPRTDKTRRALCGRPRSIVFMHPLPNGELPESRPPVHPMGLRPGPRGVVQGGDGQGCIGREGTSEAALEAVRQAVGGGCQNSWGRLLPVTNAVEIGTWH